MFKTDKIPTGGYILKRWNQTGFRATAHAYLKRENLFAVENVNGKWYNIIQIENAMIK